MTIRLRNYVLLIFILLFSGFSTAAEIAPSPTSTTPVSIVDPVLASQIKAELSKELGVPLDQLHDETDLVKDLHLDRAEVYNAVEKVLDSHQAAREADDLSRVSDIVTAVYVAKHAAKPQASTEMSVENEDVGEEHESYVQTVYYATDRKATGAAAPEDYFGGERSEHGVLSFGSAEVNIPKSHKTGMIETPWLGLKTLRDPRHHIFILKLEPEDKDGFFAGMAAQSPGDVVVYVHGFNVSFENAILRVAQMSVDFGFKGIPIVYSWPSNASLTAYNTDWENVNWSTEHIASFLEELAEKMKGRKIHLVAHSMGSKGLLNALRLLAAKGKTDMFGTIILCAPDYDAGMFADQVAGEVRPLAAQWVIYTSNKDVALMASEEINTLRLGTPVTLAEGFEIIDASEVEVTPWSVPETHSYYATKKVVLDDMVRALGGLVATARGLKPKQVLGGTVWMLQ